MSRLALRLYLGCSSCLVFVGLSASARADDKAACVAAYEDAQTLRAKSSLRSAHDKLVVCSAQACPKVVADQCTGWLDEVEKATPTVNFAVTDEQGHDLTDVRVSFDGELLKPHLDGKAIGVDPGPHVFKFESGNRKPIEEPVVVREGEKNRQIVITWKASTTTSPGPVAGGTDHPAEKSSGGLSPAFWVLGGVGVVGLGLFGTFGGLGLSQKGKDAGTGGCAPKCTDSEVSSIRTKFIVADVSLTVGLVSLAGAAAFGIVSAVSGGSKSKAAALPFTITAGPAPGGGYFGVDGSF